MDSFFSKWFRFSENGFIFQKIVSFFKSGYGGSEFFFFVFQKDLFRILAHFFFRFSEKGFVRLFSIFLPFSEKRFRFSFSVNSFVFQKMCSFFRNWVCPLFCRKWVRFSEFFKDNNFSFFRVFKGKNK